MKKVLLLVVTLFVVLSCGFSGAAYAEENTSSADYKKTVAYNFVQEFCEKFPNRKAGITANFPAEDSVQHYLKQQLLTATNGAANVEYKSFPLSDAANAFNIEARLNKQGADKQIIIGAHYDSDGQGANDNASGVAALLIAAQTLSRNVTALPCNVVFVLFDAEENGLLGSYKYVNEMTQTEKDNTLAVINIDCIANGDNLYVWCENKHTDLADLIVSKSDKLTEKPYAKGTFNLNNGIGYGYVEIPQNSDHTPFRMAGIPIALFFSGTYSADPWNYAESENPLKNTMNSATDTFENLDKNNGAEFVAKIEATANAISQTVLDVSFLTVAENQRSQMIDYNVFGRSLWARIICFGLLVGAVLVALFYSRKLEKRSILGTAEIKNDKIFTTPDADDIFAFDGKKSADTTPSADDIFTFDGKDKK